MVGKIRNAYKILVGKPQGNRSLGRIGHIQEDNIKINLTEIAYEYVDSI
jgi:hypothetical protein